MDNGACSYRRYLEGDQSAVDEIMKEFFFDLVYFIDRYVNDVHSAEDIAMDVMTDLFVKKKYNFKVGLKTFLFMLGKHRAIDHLRRRKAHPTESIESAGEIANEREELEDRVIADERKRIVSAALSKLSPDMREVVHLIYFEELTYDEAAKVMNRNRKAVDNLLYRAKKELYVILKEEGRELI